MIHAVIPLALTQDVPEETLISNSNLFSPRPRVILNASEVVVYDDFNSPSVSRVSGLIASSALNLRDVTESAAICQVSVWSP